jgi:hypothetical protein
MSAGSLSWPLTDDDHQLELSAQHTSGAVAAVTVASGGLVEAPGSKVTSAGSRRERTHCQAGSAGEHRGCGDSCTGGGDVPTSCRKPSALNMS